MDDLSPLTDGEAKALVAFAEEAASGRTPTVREIAKRLRLRATLWAHQLLIRLAEKGYLRRLPRRGFALADAGEFLAAILGGGRGGLVPVMGQIAAGQPIFVAERAEGVLKVDRSAIRARGPLFALRVKGDSMTGDAILDGDYVLVREQPTVDPGDIAVVALGETATIKRVHRTRRGLELRPSNPKHAPILVRPGEDVSVAGKVVGVIRGDVR